MKEIKGIELKIARIRAGYRPYEVAALLNIHPSQLSEIESGRRQPPAQLIQKLQKILGLIENR